MTHFTFTLDDLDQTVLDALARKQQRLEQAIDGDGQVVEETLQERLRRAMLRRIGKTPANGAPAKP